jgi:hypothetical protein
LLPKPSLARWVAGALLVVPLFALAACGGSDNKSSKPTKVAVSISQAGKGAKYTAPKSFKGGLVELTVSNQAKEPRSAQLVLVKGNHPAPEVIKELTGNSNKVPPWLRGEGGLGAVAPKGTATATLNLPEGKYIVGDFAGPAAGPPAYTEATATKGDNGSLPSTPTTVDAASTGKDKFEWKIDGTALKAGSNQVTFKSGGDDSLHLIAAVRVTGNPSDAEILKALKTNNGPPPKFFDQSTFANTAVLDGGKSQNLALSLPKPGKYALFCPVSDRDGGKPHFEEGLLKTVDVK